jgi:hypothetical protein
MLKQLKLILTVVALTTRNANEAVVTPMVGSGGVWCQAVDFVLMRLAGIFNRR